MINSLESWLAQEFGTEKFRPDLTRIKLALKDLIPELNKIKAVIIAGTNGKGETAHRLSALAHSSTFCTWTSPHILKLEERFTCEEGEITNKDLTRIIYSCHERVKKNHYELSYYEFLFYVFCHWVLERTPKFLFLEVGLGGLYDAVNVLDAECVLLTSISRDHQEILGNRYDLILKEKLGVVRSHSTLFTFLAPKYLRNLTHLLVPSGTSVLHLQDCTDVQDFEFSKRNQLLANVAWRFLVGESVQSILDDPFKSFSFTAQGLAHRGDVLDFKGTWHFYGSHNTDGIRKLIHFLRSANYNLDSTPFDLIIASFSKRSVEDIKHMLWMLKKADLGRLIITSFDHPKAYPAHELELLVSKEGIEFATDAASLIKNITDQNVLVLGSYYFIGHVRELLIGQRECSI
jgi:dihydrofolate synthase/folylpolyglutamate synthase